MTVRDPRLGRVYRGDPRNFQVRRLVEGTPLRGRGWPLVPRLDQGASPACTGFSAAHDLAAMPQVVQGVDNTLAAAIYDEARRDDEFPGENYEGSSVLGASRALKALGFEGVYAFADGIDDLLLALGHVGPAVIGSDWLEGMMDAPPSGLLTVDGAVAGGHAYLARGLIVGRDAKRRFIGRGVELRSEPLVYGTNSWGRGWGRAGDWAMWASDLERLLTGVESPGEARISTSAFRRAPAATPGAAQ